MVRRHRNDGAPKLAVIAVVAALFGLGFSACSESSSGDSAPTGPFGPESGVISTEIIALSAEASDGAVLLTWESSAAEAEHVVWYRAELPGAPWDGQGLVEGDSPVSVGATQTATLTGLQNDTTYYFAVSAVSGGEPGAPSEWAKATPRRDAGSMVLVPAGVFTMGAQPFVNDPDEEPAHPVYLDAYWMDRYVATNADYRGCVDAGVCPRPAADYGFIEGPLRVDDYFDNPLYDSFPVVFLEYDSARAYCEWQDKRLPTEAEWEKAARGANDEGWPHPWGDETPTCEIANYSDDGLFCVGGPLPVGTYASVNESPYGAIEMGGNAWQWTSDWYAADYYADSPCENPAGPEDGGEKVLRGGAWYYPAAALTVTYRNTWAPEFTFLGNEFGDYRGFAVRCVAPADTVDCDPATAVCAVPDDAACHGSEPETDASDADIDGPDSDIEGGDSDVLREDVDSEDVDSEDGDGSDADGVDSDTEDIDVELPCEWPQDEPTDPATCLEEEKPTCPSGWPEACAVKSCACALNTTTEAPECKTNDLNMDLVWRNAELEFESFVPGQNYEMCQGFQGGFHLALFVEVDDPGLDEGVNTFVAKIDALATIGEIKVGGLALPSIPMTKTESGRFRSKLLQVVFESCEASFFTDEEAVIEVLIRYGEDRYDVESAPLILKDDVEGGYLFPGEQGPC